MRKASWRKQFLTSVLQEVGRIQMDKQMEEMAGGCGWSEGQGKQGPARMPLEARLRSWF